MGEAVWFNPPPALDLSTHPAQKMLFCRENQEQPQGLPYCPQRALPGQRPLSQYWPYRDLGLWPPALPSKVQSLFLVRSCDEEVRALPPSLRALALRRALALPHPLTSPAFAQRVGLPTGWGARVYQAPPIPAWNLSSPRSQVRVGGDPRKKGWPS